MKQTASYPAWPHHPNAKQAGWTITTALAAWPQRLRWSKGQWKIRLQKLKTTHLKHEKSDLLCSALYVLSSSAVLQSARIWQFNPSHSSVQLCQSCQGFLSSREEFLWPGGAEIILHLPRSRVQKTINGWPDERRASVFQAVNHEEDDGVRSWIIFATCTKRWRCQSRGLRQ